jgi:hypothetical protein
MYVSIPQSDAANNSDEQSCAASGEEAFEVGGGSMKTRIAALRERRRVELISAVNTAAAAGDVAFLKQVCRLYCFFVKYWSPRTRMQQSIYFLSLSLFVSGSGRRIQCSRLGRTQTHAVASCSVDWSNRSHQITACECSGPHR